MIYRVRVTNPDDGAFRQEYLMPGEATFDTFCVLLRRELSLEPGHLVSFNVRGPSGEHGLELTMLDIESEGPDYPMVPMGDVRLMDILTSIGSRVLFTYNLLLNAALDVELVEIVEGRSTTLDGECVLRVGSAPQVSQEAFIALTRGNIDSLLSDMGVEVDG